MNAQTLKITTIGNSAGLVLPKELLAHFHAVKGDTLYATPCKEGVMLSAYDPQVEEEIALGQAFMNEYRETFKVLAQ